MSMHYERRARLLALYARSPATNVVGMVAKERDLTVGELRDLLSNAGWISVRERRPEAGAPVVYCRPKPGGGWSVGLAYWTVSKTWHPEYESAQAPDGFTHWMPLPEPPA